MTDDEQDEIFRLLGELQTVAPARAHDARVRARCHAAMAARRTRPVASRSTSGRIVDAALAVSVGLYGIFVIAEALRIGWHSLG